MRTSVEVELELYRVRTELTRLEELQAELEEELEYTNRVATRVTMEKLL